MKQHKFRSTAAAYDACQCDESIVNGDVLIIESEKVVGVAHTWPIAVTIAIGDLHKMPINHSPELWAVWEKNPALYEGWKAAIKIAESLGWEVR